MLRTSQYVDKRLAGIQAVQTLSRQNRAHPGKDTTYILPRIKFCENGWQYIDRQMGMNSI